MKSLLLTLAFILELVAFVAFSALGFTLHTSIFLKFLIFTILFILLISFWAAYMAPRASKKFSSKPYYVAKLLIYAVSAFVLFRLYGNIAGLLFMGAFIADELLLYTHNTSH